MAVQVAERIAVATGSSRGIGRKIAPHLVGCGITRIAIHYHDTGEAVKYMLDAIHERGAEGHRSSSEDFARGSNWSGDVNF